MQAQDKTMPTFQIQDFFDQDDTCSRNDHAHCNLRWKWALLEEYNLTMGKQTAAMIRSGGKATPATPVTPTTPVAARMVTIRIPA